MVLALVTPTSIDPDQWHVLYVTYYSASVRVLRNPSAASRRDCCTYLARQASSRTGEPLHPAPVYGSTFRLLSDRHPVR